MAISCNPTTFLMVADINTNSTVTSSSDTPALVPYPSNVRNSVHPLIFSYWASSITLQTAVSSPRQCRHSAWGQTSRTPSMKLRAICLGNRVTLKRTEAGNQTLLYDDLKKQSLSVEDMPKGPPQMYICGPAVDTEYMHHNGDFTTKYIL